MPALSITTVYRILESFEREGLVRRVATADGHARFDANQEPHQHLVCRACGRISDFHAGNQARVRIPGDCPPDFAPEHVEIHIVGRCRGCVEHASRAPVPDTRARRRPQGELS